MAEILQPPVLTAMPQRRFAGLVRRYSMQARGQIPGQWSDYNEAGVRVPGAVPDGYYGVAFNHAGDIGSFDYLCGQEVSETAALPAGFGAVAISGTYARFVTLGHISTMNAVWDEVFGIWLKRPAYLHRPGPPVEHYPPEFNGMTGEGGFEIWVPVQGRDGPFPTIQSGLCSS